MSALPQLPAGQCQACRLLDEPLVWAEHATLCPCLKAAVALGVQQRVGTDACCAMYAGLHVTCCKADKQRMNAQSQAQVKPGAPGAEKQKVCTTGVVQLATIQQPCTAAVLCKEQLGAVHSALQLSLSSRLLVPLLTASAGSAAAHILTSCATSWSAGSCLCYRHDYFSASAYGLMVSSNCVCTVYRSLKDVAIPQYSPTRQAAGWQGSRAHARRTCLSLQLCMPRQEAQTRVWQASAC